MQIQRWNNPWAKKPLLPETEYDFENVRASRPLYIYYTTLVLQSPLARKIRVYIRSTHIFH